MATAPDPREPPVRVRLLGPVAVEPGGERLVGVRRKSVLALLALQSGQLVSTDLLIASVWGEDPPSTARNTLQSHVSFLRKLLGPEHVRTVDRAGYALTVPAGSVDVSRHQQLVQAAKEARRTADLGAARDALLQAGGLVTGEPLADVREVDALDRHARRLEEELLAAAEALAEVRLSLGEHVEALAALDRLCDRHPYAERLHELRLLALYRAGRTQAALVAYQDVRRLLAEELGVQPGPSLRELEVAILRQDPALDLPAGPSPVAAAHPPRAARPALVGRDDDLDRLRALLGTRRLVSVVGPGGVGKTALCRVALADEPGARWADLSGAAPDGVGRVVAAALGLEWDVGAGPVGLADAAGRSLRAGSVLLCLDSCEHVLEVAGELAGLLTERGLRVLASSQERLHLAGEQVLALGPLPADAAADLLGRRGAEADPAFRVTDDVVTTLRRIAVELDGMPLALELAAARLRYLTPAEVAEGLDDRFAVLAGGGRDQPERQRSLHATLSWSHDRLTASERDAFALLGVCTDGVAPAEAALLTGLTDPAAFHQVTAGLVDKSMLLRGYRRERTRLSMHQSVRAFAVDRLASSGREEAARADHAHTYAGLVAEAFTRFHGPGQRAALHRVEDDDANVEAATRWATGRDPATALRLGTALWWYWFRTSRAARGADLLDRAVRAADPADPLLPDGLSGLGYLAWVGDDYQRARRLAERSLALLATRSAPGPAASASRGLALGVLARALGDLGDFASAYRLADEGATEFARAGDPWSVAWSQRTGASALLYGGDPGAARRLGARALAGFDAAQDSWGAAGTVDLLATIAERDGRADEAVRLAQESLDRYRVEEDSVGTRYALQHLAEAARTAGRAELARKSAAEALDVARTHGYRVGMLQALLLLADVAGTGGDSTALAHAREARDLAGELGDAAAVARVVELLARVRRESADGST